jgi:hypothetical protein
MFMRLIWLYILPPVAFKYDSNHPNWYVFSSRYIDFIITFVPQEHDSECA